MLNGVAKGDDVFGSLRAAEVAGARAGRGGVLNVIDDGIIDVIVLQICLLYTSDAADE